MNIKEKFMLKARIEMEKVHVCKVLQSKKGVFDQSLQQFGTVLEFIFFNHFLDIFSGKRHF